MVKKRIKLVDDFFILSTNFGPYNDSRWRDDCEEIYSLCKDVCFRDVESYKLFNDLDNVRYACDAVLSLGIKHINDQEKIILISAIDCKMDERSMFLKHYADDYERSLNRIMKYFISLNYRVIFINSNSEQDSLATDRIIHGNTSYNVEVFNYAGNLSDLYNLYKKASYVISTRLHTTVLAWLYGIPVIPISYDIKMTQIINSVGFNNPYYQIENIKELSEEIASSIFEEYDFSIDIEKINDANRQFEILDNVINERRGIDGE